MTGLLTTLEVAEWLKVSPKTVLRYTHQGLPCFELPGGRRYDPDEVYEWMEQHRPSSNGDIG